MIEKEFKPDVLYSKIVHYYMDKKGYGKAKANSIAERVVQRETQRRICRTEGCGHLAHDHLRNTAACLVSHCACTSFSSASGPRDTDTRSAPAADVAAAAATATVSAGTTA